MRKIALAATLVALSTMAACKKTGEGEYTVEKPVVGTVTDTVHTPSVETGTKTDSVNVPVVKTEKRAVKVPTVTVKKPNP